MLILRVRNKEGSTRVSLPPSSSLNDLISELRTQRIDVKGPEELYWDLGGANPVLGGKIGADASAPLAAFNLTHGCLVYIKQSADTATNTNQNGRSLVEDKGSTFLAEKKEHKPTECGNSASDKQSKEGYTSLKGLPPPPPIVNEHFSSHDSLHSLDEAHCSDSKGVRAPDSVQRMTLVDDRPVPLDSLSAAYAVYDEAMEEQIKANAMELGMTEWEMQLEIQRLRDERMAQRMQAEMLLENFGNLGDDMDDYLRDMGDVAATHRSSTGGRSSARQRSRRRPTGQSIDCPAFLEDDDSEGENVDTEALIKRMDSLLGISGSGSQRKQKAADAKHAPSGAKSIPKKAAARNAVEDLMVSGAKVKASDAAAAGSKIAVNSNSSQQQWSRSNNKARSNSFDILREDDCGDDGEGEEDYLLSKRLQREERDYLEAARLHQQLQEEEDAALAQQVQGQQSPTPQPMPRMPLADISLPDATQDDEPSLEQLEEEQRLFFQHREAERDRMRNFISDAPRPSESSLGAGRGARMLQSLDSSLDETILNLALAQSMISTRPPTVVQGGDDDDDNDDDDLAKAIRESLMYK